MKERCEATAANFRETYALAMRGDYEGLMNAGAFMLETPDAHWPIKQDALLGCTWSLVAISNGSPKVNTGELKIYEGRCVRDRSPTERAVIGSKPRSYISNFMEGRFHPTFTMQCGFPAHARVRSFRQA